MGGSRGALQVPRWDRERHDVERDVRSRLFGATGPESSLSRYVLGRCLGRGAFGEVFEATDPDLQRPVAIKVARPRARSPQARARFLREARELANLTHPNVVSVFDFGILDEEDGAIAFLVMERLALDLRQWMKADHDREARLAMLVEAGRGLAAAHDVGLVHRDFKPSNVLIGNDGRPRVADFGLVVRSASDTTRQDRAGLAGWSDTTERLTMAGVVMGTPPYMAPEQHAGDVVDARADQFAFCIVLYEACCGHSPFLGRTPDELYRAKEAHEIREPNERGSLSPRLRRVIERGLHPDPRSRYAGMPELLAAIEQARRPALHRRVPAIAALVVGLASTPLVSPTQSVPQVKTEAMVPAAARPAWDSQTQARVQRLVALDREARWPELIEAATALSAQGLRTQDERLLAVALFRRGRAYEQTNRLVEAVSDLEAAYFTALDIDDLRTSTAAAGALVLIHAGRGDRDAAQVWAAHARAVLERRPDPPLQAGMATAEAAMYLEAGEYDRALDRAREAVALQETARGSRAAAGARNLLARALMLSGREDEGIEQLRTALTDLEQYLGALHPNVGSLVGNLGTALGNAGRHDEAIVHLERAIEIATANHGPDHPMVVGYRGNLAIEHLRAGDSARAVEELERVLADTERLRGPEHPNTAYLHTRLGQALVEEHRTEEGLAEIRRGLITQQTMLGPSHPDVLETVALLEQITRRNAEEPRL